MSQFVTVSSRIAASFENAIIQGIFDHDDDNEIRDDSCFWRCVGFEWRRNGKDGGGSHGSPAGQAMVPKSGALAAPVAKTANPGKQSPLARSQKVPRRLSLPKWPRHTARRRLQARQKVIPTTSGIRFRAIAQRRPQLAARTIALRRRSRQLGPVQARPRPRRTKLMTTALSSSMFKTGRGRARSAQPTLT